MESLLRKAISNVEGIHDLAASLERLLNSGCYVWSEPSGDRLLVQGRALVQKIEGLRICIYSTEHPPPHFHVISAEIDASFSIENCEVIKGNVDKRTKELIKVWFDSGGLEKLVEIWNKTRPTNCQVGQIRTKA